MRQTKENAYDTTFPNMHSSNRHSGSTQYIDSEDYLEIDSNHQGITTNSRRFFVKNFLRQN